jgi:hypothetical protein
MNRTLLSAILIMAFTAMNCFAAETQRPAATATNPNASLPVASQAIATPPAPQAPSAQAILNVGSGQAEKSSPIVEADSRQDGIAPQKNHFGEADSADIQAAKASAAGARKVYAPKMKVFTQATSTNAPPEVADVGSSSRRVKSTQEGCSGCKKKTQPPENPTGTDATK